MRRLFLVLAIFLVIGGGGFFWLTRPRPIPAESLPSHAPDLTNGEYMFYAGGCASCHATPKGGKCSEPDYENAQELAGGRCLKTPFGTFYVPNISPHPDYGIGRWSDADFINAMRRGLSPAGEHYYPAFPYTSYQRMYDADLIDLKAYLDTLPAVASRVPPHDLRFPFNFRRALGLWKLAFLDGKRFTPDPRASPEVNRGAYLVQGPGHCGECHTPRNFLGGFLKDRWLAGAPAPEGKGFVPNLTPHESGLKSWSASDIAYALESGFKPDFDVLGGAMTKVQENMAKLTPEDRAAIAAYLKSLPPLPATRTK